jgi:YegS/Rv2252/BmrU family lipid kinase
VKVRAIVNLRAGVAAHRALDAFETGRPSWPHVEVRLTEGPGHAIELARSAVQDGVDLVLATGGDGTVNEAARGLLGSNVPLGVVPVGSGNGLARALRIPLRPKDALAALEGGRARRMDVGYVNGKPFLNVAGVGFDAVVGWAFHLAGRDGARRGVLRYVWMSFGLLGSYRARPLTIETDEGRLETCPFVLTCANGPQYGGGAVLNPGARLDDGRFEIVVFEDAPILELVATAPRLFLGGIERTRRYRRLVTTRALIRVSPPAEHHRDGEPEPEADVLEVTLAPRSLTVLVPRATAEDAAGPFQHTDA